MSPNPQTPSQIKSRKRVTDHGEVFTPDWLVNDMLNLVAHEAERIDSRFLEPACGEGAFLAPILLRKLESVRRQYGSSPADYEFRAVLALMSIYGVELLADNVRACRERLLILWLAEYEQRLKCPPSAECQKTVRFVLERNILNGNALSMNQVDDAAQIRKTPSSFLNGPPWAAPSSNAGTSGKMNSCVIKAPGLPWNRQKGNFLWNTYPNTRYESSLPWITANCRKQNHEQRHP